MAAVVSWAHQRTGEVRAKTEKCLVVTPVCRSPKIPELPLLFASGRRSELAAGVHFRKGVLRLSRLTSRNRVIGTNRNRKLLRMCWTPFWVLPSRTEVRRRSSRLKSGEGYFRDSGQNLFRIGVRSKPQGCGISWGYMVENGIFPRREGRIHPRPP
jgi:hypothetical protein